MNKNIKINVISQYIFTAVKSLSLSLLISFKEIASSIIKHIGSFRSRVANACRYRVGALLLAVAFQRSVNNLYALFSFSVLSLSVFLFSNNTFALPSYSMSLSTSSPNITQDIKVSLVGKTIIIPQTVTINSNNPHGIKLFISSKDDKLVPTKTTPVINTSTPISPVPGDISNPSILNMNSFGFALPNESDNPLSSNFSTNNIYTSNDKNLKNAAKFSKLTNKHNPIEIYQNKSTTTNKQLTVYYGTKINSVIDKGTYTLDILYTLIPNLAGTNTTPGQNNQEVLTIEEGNNNTLELTPAKLTKAQGNETLTIKVNSSLPNYNSADLIINAYINNKQCNNATIETLNPISIKCTTPPNNPGKYDLKLNIFTKSGKVLVNFNKNNAVEYMESLLSKFTHMQDKGLYQACENTYEHDTATLIDKRDNQQYTIAKLKDGKCWMTQNLRLKLNTSTTLTSSDTDLNNTTSWTPTHTTEQFSTSGGSYGQGSGSNWGSDYKADKSGFRSDNYNTHGVYYSYGSATANSAKNLNNNGDEIPNSICPKGWRLPKTTSHYSNSDFYHMAQYYKGSSMSWTTYDNGNGGYWYNSSHNMTNAPIPSFKYSGTYDYSSSSLYGIGSIGSWWLSTMNVSSDAYRMRIGSSIIYPRYNGMRLYGFSVRCILKEPTSVSDIQYMQDFNSQMCTKMTEHQTATLTDKRDNQQYTIAKLKDGKCWMIQNLRLKLNINTALTSADTDLNNTTSWTPTHTTEQFSMSGGSNGQGSGSNWGSDKKADKSGFRPDNYSTHGIYYSHGAATANSARNLDGKGNEAPNSICPKGWRLPSTTTSYTGGEFYNMAQHYKGSASWSDGYYWSGSHSMTNTPIPNFQYSGYYNYGNSSLDRIVSDGYWWSSTISDSSSAYNMTMDSSYVFPRNNRTRLNGFSVRCLSR